MGGATRASRRDHPRLRGEHCWMLEMSVPILGSSPLARGARGRHGRCRALPGIIPACAGSTPPPCSSTRRGRDHPRLRGEHALVRMARAPALGSSPLARGARQARPVRGGRPGIIPACAGSTWVAHAAPRSARDHPRLRGEHTNSINLFQRNMGSSPLARGAQRGVRLDAVGVGIIPACAGSTGSRTRRRSRCRDHPRLRGEHNANVP